MQKDAKNGKNGMRGKKMLEMGMNLEWQTKLYTYFQHKERKYMSISKSDIDRCDEICIRFIYLKSMKNSSCDLLFMVGIAKNILFKGRKLHKQLYPDP